MKLLNNYKLFVVFIAGICCNAVIAQEEKPRLLVEVGYHLTNNQIPSVSVFTKAKIEKKFVAVPNITVNVYLGQEADSNLLGTIKTNKEGRGEINFPVSAKSLWDTVSQFTLLASTVADKNYKSASGEVSATKAKIFIDTVNVDGTRSITATVKAKKGNDWVPVKDVETKIIVKRSVGNLSVGDEETFTTDSTGQVTAEFKKTTIPGDKDGNIVIVAKTEDNELYGSISIEQKAKWGVPFNGENTFNRRTLFATRDKAPLWLLLLAGSIFISVWSVIVYLIMQIARIRKLGIESHAGID